MQCSGNCYCGSDCQVNHEEEARVCDCVNGHRMCSIKCDLHPLVKCVWIAQHKGNHECALCVLEEYHESN